jgi:GTP cyclohydrolase II
MKPTEGAMTDMRPGLLPGDRLAAAARPHVMVRAVADLRCGDFVVLRDGESAVLAVPAEAIDETTLGHAVGLTAAPPLLVTTRRRALSLGLLLPEAIGQAVALALPEGTGAAELNELADPTLIGRMPPLLPMPAPIDAGRFGAAAIELAKLARLLPAMVLFPLQDSDALWLTRHAGIMTLELEQITQHRTVLARSLRRVVDAAVPLADAENARIIAFRPDDGGTEHLAILIGEPPPDQPVLARIHSECFTGDLLASLRCDCGEQLREAIRRIAANGGGVVIYLAQEGRGIGLVNKLRAYRLQDAGFDTVEANEELGFEADERVYQPAAEMLRQLGFERVRLLTNNPEKVAALARHDIEVTERVPHAFAANEHNHRYLSTKASKSGHLF